MVLTETQSRWSVYMVETDRGQLYTGISTDVARRFRQHVAGKGARSLRGARLLTLCWQEEVASHGDALRAERGIKSLSAADKRALCCEPGRRRRVVHALSAKA